MEMTTEEKDWLRMQVTTLRNGLRDKGLSCKIAESRDPILTPNSALITFKGDSNLTAKKIETVQSELLTSYGLEILYITEGPGTLAISLKREARAILNSRKIFSEIFNAEGFSQDDPKIFIAVEEENAQPLFLDHSGAPHTLISGATGSGKSVLIQNILVYLSLTNSPDEAQIYLVDGKQGVDYKTFKNLPHLKKGSGKIITQKEDSIELLSELHHEMEERYRLFDRTDQDNITNYNKSAKNPLPRIYYFQDEFAAWMMDKEYSKEIEHKIGEIGVKARAAGIFLFFGLQRPDKDVMPVQLRDQLGNRLTLRVTDKGTAEIATSEAKSGAEKLLKHGHMLAKLDSQFVRCQVPFISQPEIKKIVEGLALKYGNDEISDGIIYADTNATTPVSHEVVGAMAPYWNEKFHNPRSPAGERFGSEHPVRLAPTRLSSLLGGEHSNYALTSGATEANNWALDLAINRALKAKSTCHILISEVEHVSVLQAAQHRSAQDDRISLETIKVTSDGVVDTNDLTKKLKSDTDFVSVMLANNESGVIQPVKEIAGLVKKTSPSCLVHTDATQAVGKIPVDLENDLVQVDLLSLSAHKIGGPKGIGALFIRDVKNTTPFIVGGSQQNGLRGGTENPPLAAGFLKAIEFISTKENIQHQADRVSALRDQLEIGLGEICPKSKVLGRLAPRLANTSLVVFPAFEGDMLVHQLLEDGIIVSTGAACSNGADSPSHVVVAMGVDYSTARNVLRISLSHTVTIKEIGRLLASLKAILTDL